MDDTPVSFGYKSAWVAVGTTDTRAVAKTLGLQRAVDCSWQDGVNGAYKLLGVFVTPPIRGWTLAVGKLPELSDKRCLSLLEQISRRFKLVFYFGTHRIVEYQAWGIAEEGDLRRAHVWSGERGEFLLNIGERTPVEIELGAGIEDFEQAPNEETVLELASRWTIDPRELDSMTDARGPGLFGKP
jgi:hypothetical protein